MLYLNTLKILTKKISDVIQPFMNSFFEKNLGLFTQKNVVLGLEKPLHGKKSAREEVFWGLKQRFLSLSIKG